MRQVSILCPEPATVCSGRRGRCPAARHAALVAVERPGSELISTAGGRDSGGAGLIALASSAGPARRARARSAPAHDPWPRRRRRRDRGRPGRISAPAPSARTSQLIAPPGGRRELRRCCRPVGVDVGVIRGTMADDRAASLAQTAATQPEPRPRTGEPARPHPGGGGCRASEAAQTHVAPGFDLRAALRSAALTAANAGPRCWRVRKDGNAEETEDLAAKSRSSALWGTR